MRFRSWVGVVIGGITDIATSMLIFFALAVIAAAQLPPSELAPEAQGPAITSAMSELRGLTIASWFFSYGATLLGGYVAACISRVQEVRVGVLSAWTCMLAGVMILATNSSPMPAWQVALIFGSTPFVAGLGGYLRLRQTQRRDAAAIQTSPTSTNSAR
jgi:hypothetical protein